MSGFKLELSGRPMDILNSIDDFLQFNGENYSWMIVKIEGIRKEE